MQHLPAVERSRRHFRFRGRFFVLAVARVPPRCRQTVLDQSRVTRTSTTSSSTTICAWRTRTASSTCASSTPASPGLARSLELREIAALENVCLVQADLLACTSSVDYFSDCVRRCEENYDGWLLQRQASCSGMLENSSNS